MYENMAGINRERGSLTEPYYEEQVAGSSYVWNYPEMTLRSETQRTHVSASRYKYIADQYEEYGIGVWGYKPLFSAQASFRTNHPTHFPCPGCSNEFTRCSGVAWGGCPQWSLSGGDSPNDVSLPVEVREDLKNRLDARLPSLGDGMPDMAVFLWELQDFKGLWNAMVEGVRNGSFLTGVSGEIIDWFRHFADGFTSAKLSTILTTMAESHLEWAFVWRPLISDIQKIMNNMAGWKERVEAVRAGIGKVHDLSTFVSWDESDQTIEDMSSVHMGCPAYTGDGTGSCPHCRQTDKIWSYKTTSKAGITVKYRYSWPSIADGWTSSIEEFLLANRLLPTYESLWEIIPFSFVIDWVFNTEKLFDALNLDEVTDSDVHVAIVDACVTLKRQRDTKLDYTQRGIDTGLACTEKFFYRWVGDDALSLLDWDVKVPSFMQFLLGASLVEVLRH